MEIGFDDEDADDWPAVLLLLDVEPAAPVLDEELGLDEVTGGLVGEVDVVAA